MSKLVEKFAAAAASRKQGEASTTKPETKTSALPGLTIPPVLPVHGSIAAAQQSKLHAEILDLQSRLSEANAARGASSSQAAELRALLDSANEELQTASNEIQSLAIDVKAAQGGVLLDANDIGPSRFANRIDDSFHDRDYEELKREILASGGNVQAIKVRRAPQGSSKKYEIVFGHRRHRACLELGLKVRAIIEDVDDQRLFIEMERENRSRKNLSAYEQGLMYVRAIDSGLFSSNEELGDAVGVHKSQVGKAIALARLPEKVVQAFASPLDLKFGFRTGLERAIKNDESGVLSRADKIAKDRMHRSPQAIYEELIAIDGSTVLPHPEVVSVEAHGESVAEIRINGNGTGSVVIPARMDKEKADQLALFLAKLLGSTVLPK